MQRDAGLPAVVVGGSDAERASEEDEDGTSNPCLSDRDCDRGFACVASRCTWRRYREATFEGCGAQATNGSWLLGAALLLRARRPARHFLSNFTK